MQEKKVKPLYIAAGGGLFVILIGLYIFLSPPSAASLGERFTSGSADEQREAVKMAKNYDNYEKIYILTAALNSRHGNVRQSAVSQLRPLSRDALPDLMGIIEDESSYSEGTCIAAMQVAAYSRSDEAKRSIYRLIQNTSSDAIRQAGIASLVDSFEEYNDRYVLMNGVWYEHSELKRQGYVKTDTGWVSLTDLIAESEKKIERFLSRKESLEEAFSMSPEAVDAGDWISYFQEGEKILRKVKAIHDIAPAKKEVLGFQNQITGVLTATMQNIEGSVNQTDYEEEIQSTYEDINRWPWVEKTSQVEEIITNANKWQSKEVAVKTEEENEDSGVRKRYTGSIVQKKGSTMSLQNAVDKILLKDGKIVEGLIEKEDKKSLTLVSIWQGSKTSSMVIRQNIAKSKIKKMKRLKKETRDARLAVILNQKENRASEEEAIQQIYLKRVPWEFNSKVLVYEYEGDNFVLHSQTSQDLAKRMAYRTREIFKAYKEFFQLERNTGYKVKIYIFGSMDEYYAAIGGRMLNPAFYMPAKNLVAAGCDLAKYKHAVAEVKRHHDNLQEQLRKNEEIVKNIRYQIRTHKKQQHEKLDHALKTGGISRSYWKQAYKQLRKWESQEQSKLNRYVKEAKRLEKEIRLANHHNRKLLKEYTGDMIKLLYHESFHAFTFNFLFHDEIMDKVPLWIHEGLAQFFENSFIEGDQLIIGKPGSRHLKLIRKYIRNKQVVSLEHFLTADSNQFLVEDMTNLENSTIHYLQSWAIVYYLAEKYDLSKGNFFHLYVQALDDGMSPKEAFESLTQMTLEEFDKEWKEAALKWK